MVEPIETSARRGVRRKQRRRGRGKRTGKRILHPVTLQRVLELGAHKAVSLSRVAQHCEVNRKHGHVEEGGNTDEADRAGDKVANEEGDGNPQVAEEEPELDDGVDSDRCDGE